MNTATISDCMTASFADTPFPVVVQRLAGAARFEGAMGEATVKVILRRDIGYAVFLLRIMRAVCASYSVYFGGRKAVYFGRDGDSYTEPFPAAK